MPSELCLKSLKKNLRDAIKQSGAICDIKSRIRKEIVCFISEENKHVQKDLFSVCDFHDRLSISCIYSFLSKKCLEKTLSVFLAETGYDSEHFFLPESEIESVLHISHFNEFGSSSLQPSATILHKIFNYIEALTSTRYFEHGEARVTSSVALPNPISDHIESDASTLFKASSTNNASNQIFTANTNDNNSSSLAVEEKLKELQKILQLRDESLTEREKNLDTNLQNYDKNISSYKSNICELENQITQLKDSISSRNVEIEKLKELNTLLKDEIELVNQKFVEATTSKATTNNSSNINNPAVEKMKKKSMELIKNLELYKKELKIEKSKMVALQYKYDELSNIISDQQKTIDILQKMAATASEEQVIVSKTHSSHTAASNTPAEEANRVTLSRDKYRTSISLLRSLSYMQEDTLSRREPMRPKLSSYPNIDTYNMLAQRDRSRDGNTMLRESFSHMENIPFSNYNENRDYDYHSNSKFQTVLHPQFSRHMSGNIDSKKSSVVDYNFESMQRQFMPSQSEYTYEANGNVLHNNMFNSSATSQHQANSINSNSAPKHILNNGPIIDSNIISSVSSFKNMQQDQHLNSFQSQTQLQENTSSCDQSHSSVHNNVVPSLSDQSNSSYKQIGSENHHLKLQYATESSIESMTRQRIHKLDTNSDADNNCHPNMVILPNNTDNQKQLLEYNRPILPKNQTISTDRLNSRQAISTNQAIIPSHSFDNQTDPTNIKTIPVMSTESTTIHENTKKNITDHEQQNISVVSFDQSCTQQPNTIQSVHDHGTKSSSSKLFGRESPNSDYVIEAIFISKDPVDNDDDDNRLSNAKDNFNIDQSNQLHSSSSKQTPFFSQYRHGGLKTTESFTSDSSNTTGSPHKYQTPKTPSPDKGHHNDATTFNSFVFESPRVPPSMTKQEVAVFNELPITSDETMRQSPSIDSDTIAISEARQRVLDRRKNNQIPIVSHQQNDDEKEKSIDESKISFSSSVSDNNKIDSADIIVDEDAKAIQLARMKVLERRKQIASLPISETILNQQQYEKQDSLEHDKFESSQEDDDVDEVNPTSESLDSFDAGGAGDSISTEESIVW